MSLEVEEEGGGLADQSEGMPAVEPQVETALVLGYLEVEGLSIGVTQGKRTEGDSGGVQDVLQTQLSSLEGLGDQHLQVVLRGLEV